MICLLQGGIRKVGVAQLLEMTQSVITNQSTMQRTTRNELRIKAM